uniref:Secreted protein n=1 Tax=Romanomermis culicivorax TaxID=13658 RepID=A0A915IHQ2_ROMCU
MYFLLRIKLLKPGLVWAIECTIACFFNACKLKNDKSSLTFIIQKRQFTPIDCLLPVKCFKLKNEQKLLYGQNRSDKAFTSPIHVMHLANPN